MPHVYFSFGYPGNPYFSKIAFPSSDATKSANVWCKFRLSGERGHADRSNEDGIVGHRDFDSDEEVPIGTVERQHCCIGISG